MRCLAPSCLLAGLLWLGPSAPGGEEAAPVEREWTLTLDSTVASKYIWRGLNVVDDPVWQPSVAFAWKGLTLNVWGNMDLTDANGERRRFTEVDYTLDYTFQVNPWASVSVGAIYYHFPHTPFPGTTEVYAGVAFDAPLSPAFKVYRDIDEAKGTYYSLAISHTFEDAVKFAEAVKMSVELAASLGYSSSRHSRFYYGTGAGGAGLADLTVSLGFPIAIGERWTVRPALNCSWLLDSDIRRGVRGAGLDTTNCWAGLSVSFAY